MAPRRPCGSRAHQTVAAILGPSVIPGSTPTGRAGLQNRPRATRPSVRCRSCESAERARLLAGLGDRGRVRAVDRRLPVLDLVGVQRLAGDAREVVLEPAPREITGLVQRLAVDRDPALGVTALDMVNGQPDHPLDQMLRAGVGQYPDELQRMCGVAGDPLSISSARSARSSNANSISASIGPSVNDAGSLSYRHTRTPGCCMRSLCLIWQTFLYARAFQDSSVVNPSSGDSRTAVP